MMIIISRMDFFLLSRRIVFNVGNGTTAVLSVHFSMCE